MTRGTNIDLDNVHAEFDALAVRGLGGGQHRGADEAAGPRGRPLGHASSIG
jgi:hypothetical protein